MGERTVYLIGGWFGSDEWVEAIYATKDAAEKRCSELWETRRSPSIRADHPSASYLSAACGDGRPGLCKFAVEEWEVLDA